MPSVPPPPVDEGQLLLDALAVVHHALGGVAGALQMRGDALDMGAPLESGRASIRSAAEELKRLTATLQMLQAVRRPPDGPVRTLEAQAWSDMISPVVTGLMGRGFRLSSGELRGEFPTRLHDGLGVSVLAFASALRRERDDSAPVAARGTAHALTLAVVADASQGSVSLSWAEPLELNAAWVQLSHALAERAQLQSTLGATKIEWRWER